MPDKQSQISPDSIRVTGDESVFDYGIDIPSSLQGTLRSHLSGHLSFNEKYWISIDIAGKTYRNGAYIGIYCVVANAAHGDSSDSCTMSIRWEKHSEIAMFFQHSFSEAYRAIVEWRKRVQSSQHSRFSRGTLPRFSQLLEIIGSQERDRFEIRLVPDRSVVVDSVSEEPAFSLTSATSYRNRTLFQYDKTNDADGSSADTNGNTANVVDQHDDQHDDQEADQHDDQEADQEEAARANVVQEEASQEVAAVPAMTLQELQSREHDFMRLICAFADETAPKAKTMEKSEADIVSSADDDGETRLSSATLSASDKAVEESQTDADTSDDRDASDNHREKPEPGTEQQTLDQGEFPCLPHSEPTVLEVMGISYAVTNWRQVLSGFARVLYTGNPTQFRGLIGMTARPSGTHAFINRTIAGMFAPYKIDQGLWMELNYSASDIVALCRKIGTACGFNLSRVKITYRPGAPAKTSARLDTKKSEQRLLLSNDYDETEQSQLEILCRAICEQYRSGFSFKAPAESLLKAQTGITLNDFLRKELQLRMFQRKDGLWLFQEMVASGDIVADMVKKADSLLAEFGLFALDILYDAYRWNLRNLPDNDSDFSRFARVFILPNMKYYGSFVSLKHSFFITGRVMDNSELADMLAETLLQWLKYEDDFIDVVQLARQLPYLSREIITCLINEHIPAAIPDALENDVPEWKLFDKFDFPEGLSDDITTIIQDAEDTHTTVSMKTIQDALALRYHADIVENFGLTEKQFKRIITLCYKGTLQYVWKKELFVSKDRALETNLIDEFLKTTHGVFHESEFFEYAAKSRGKSNRTNLVINYLIQRCIRMDKVHWIAANEFSANASLSQQDYDNICRMLQIRLGNSPFLPFGILPDYFLEQLPAFTLFEKTVYWSNYLLASVSDLLVSGIRVENNKECSNTITAIVVPHDAELKRGVIEYVLEHYSKSGLPCNSVEVVFTYLKHNRIRISLKSSLRRIIQQYFKLDE